MPWGSFAAPRHFYLREHRPIFVEAWPIRGGIHPFVQGSIRSIGPSLTGASCTENDVRWVDEHVILPSSSAPVDMPEMDHSPWTASGALERKTHAALR